MISYQPHVYFHTEHWGIIVLWVLVGIPVLIVLTVIAMWIMARRG